MIYSSIDNEITVESRAIFKGENALPNTIGVIGYGALMKRIQRKEIKRLKRSAPGSFPQLQLNTIPLGWRQMLISEFGAPPKIINQSLFEKNYRENSEALIFFSNYILPDGKYLPTEVASEYTNNASVLDAVCKVYKEHYNQRKNLKGGLVWLDKTTGEQMSVWKITSRECNAYRSITPHTLPENADRLRLKVAEYKKEGYKCLIHKSYGTTSGARKVTDETVDLLNAMFANKVTKPTATEIARTYDGFLAGYVEVINNETGECYSPSEFKKLSTATITNYLAKWGNKSATHAIRSGDRQDYMVKFRPYHTLIQPKFANSIISIDDRQPPFEYDKNHNRVWFYNAVDLGSEAITCWVYGKDKKDIIIDFYRQLIRNYTEWGFNLPAEVECESSLNSSFKDTFLKPGAMFQYVHIAPNNARAKRCENYWKQLRYGPEKKRDGWIARPFALSEPNQKSPARIPIIEYNDIVAGCLRDIENWNNSEHSKIKGKTRWEVFCETQNPDVRPTNWRSFLPTLGYKTETSVRAGIIQFNNEKFILGNDGLIATGGELIRLMEQAEGRDIDVYWIDNSEGLVMKGIVYLRGDDRPICEAIPKPGSQRARIERTPLDDANRALFSKYVASIDIYINNKKKSINPVLIVDNRPTTLNNKFQITPKRKVNAGFEMNGWDEPEVLPTLPDDEFTASTGSATTAPDDYLNSNEISLNRSLKDRF